MHEKPFGYLIYWCIKAQKLNSLCRVKWAPVEQKNQLFVPGNHRSLGISVSRLDLFCFFIIKNPHFPMNGLQGQVGSLLGGAGCHGFCDGRGNRKEHLGFLSQAGDGPGAQCDGNTCHFLSSYSVQAATGSPLKTFLLPPPTSLCLALFAMEIKHGSSLNWGKTSFAHPKFC